MSIFMKINKDIMSTYILLSYFMKINQDIISTYILKSNFMKINQDIIVWSHWTLTGFPYTDTVPVFNVPQVIAKLVIPPNYRLHRRWRFNEGALYTLC